MTCIKTGAVVLFTEYNAIVRCDIFKIGDCYLIQAGQPGKVVLKYNPLPYDLAQVTHHLTIGTKGYWHSDRGVAVVPKDQLKIAKHPKKKIPKEAYGGRHGLL